MSVVMHSIGSVQRTSILVNNTVTTTVNRVNRMMPMAGYATEPRTKVVSNPGVPKYVLNNDHPGTENAVDPSI